MQLMLQGLQYMSPSKTVGKGGDNHQFLPLLDDAYNSQAMFIAKRTSHATLIKDRYPRFAKFISVYPPSCGLNFYDIYRCKKRNIHSPASSNSGDD